MTNNIDTVKFNFIKPTVIFCAVGFFIPGFTAIMFFLFQTIFYKFNVECDLYWKYLWIITSILAILAPIFFLKKINNFKNDRNHILTMLTLFNFLEYVFIQASFSRLITDERNICYGGGESGLELIFSAWVSLPILVFLSFVFNSKLKKY